MNIENQNIKSKLVFDYRACRALLKKGLQVIDIKPLKTDKTKPVIVFADTPEFQKAFAEITEELKKKDEAKNESSAEIAD